MTNHDDFIRGYVATWHAMMRGEAGFEALADFFHLPCLVMGAEGDVAACVDAVTLAAIAAARRESLADAGEVTPEVSDLVVTEAGPNLAHLSMIWTVRDAGGSAVAAWRQHFTVRLGGERPEILVAAIEPV